MSQPSPAAQPFFKPSTNRRLGALLALLVVLFSYVLIRVPDRLFADDSYFYLQVAWNFARGKGSTFNTIMPTNGYHPLWMLLCSFVFRLIPSRPQAVHAVGALIATLNVLTLLVVRRLLRLVADDLWPVAFLLLVAFSFLSQLGTEGALSALFLALLMLSAFHFTQTPDPLRAAFLNLSAALAVLSRLDNIFIVACVWIAVFVAHPRRDRTSARRLQTVFLLVPGVLCGAYLASNWVGFGTLQPISGLLKSNSRPDHAFGSNLPHVAILALLLILLCLPLIAVRRRDLFLRTVEIPFTLGVLIHAAYILFRMSSETRWSWYYTSWILLSSVLLARAGAILLRDRRQWAVPVAALCLLLLAAAWYRLSYVKFLLGPDTTPPASFNRVVFDQAHLRRAFAYDQPGALAYYSDIEIVPLDGLMANLEFQHDLATKGVAEVARAEHIDSFIGPPSPIGRRYVHDLCERVFLSTEQFHCTRRPDGDFDVVAADIYSRVPSQIAGTLDLDPRNIVWRKTDFIAVWRISPGAR